MSRSEECRKRGCYMSQEMIMEIGRNTILLALKLSAPVLGFGLLVGLIVSIFQAATQIQEMTLTFIPKIIAVVIALLIFGPWMMNSIYSFTVALFESLPLYAR